MTDDLASKTEDKICEDCHFPTFKELNQLYEPPINNLPPVPEFMEEAIFKKCTGRCHRLRGRGDVLQCKILITDYCRGHCEAICKKYDNRQSPCLDSMEQSCKAKAVPLRVIVSLILMYGDPVFYAKVTSLNHDQRSK